MDRALEPEAKALLRAARARLAEWVEEELAWEPKRAAEAAREAPSPQRVSAAGSLPGAREIAAPARAPSLPLGETRSLEQVRATLGECTRCPLHQGRTKIVFGDGNPSAEIMFVGEGPGEQEDLSGLPFVGRAGELLTRMIENGLQIPRASVYIANVVKCRPPNNRTPLPNEVAACREFLDAQIDAIRPKVIVALGKPATSLLLGRDVSITRVRGTWHDYRGFPVMPTFHPAFLLRQYTQENRRLVWEDLKAALERTKAP
ncbi:MAG TPA: uracil-DNA glycosylase [Myxococcota bacterium]|nr:uracil-DNA glycosylase [Myxococcota bacterium]